MTERGKQPFIDQSYYTDPARRLRTGAARVMNRALRPIGFELEVRSFYSPIPDLTLLAPNVWTTPSDLAGVVNFDTRAQLEFVRRELSTSIDEFRPPREPTGDRLAYFLSNGLFQGGDADLLYAMIRRYRPTRVIELGTGFSTLVAASACAANRRDGHVTKLVSFDPFAMPPSVGLDGLAEVRPIAAESVPADEFESLGAGDILFIDSAHAVRVGGDVNYLLLEIVPRLMPGVIVHVHDIFLPWEYPRQWAVNGWHWAEQYLLHALLVGNTGLEVLIASHAVWKAHEREFMGLVPNIDPAHPPLSFWMRRTGSIGGGGADEWSAG